MPTLNIKRKWIQRVVRTKQTRVAKKKWRINERHPYSQIEMVWRASCGTTRHGFLFLKRFPNTNTQTLSPFSIESTCFCFFSEGHTFAEGCLDQTRMQFERDLIWTSTAERQRERERCIEETGLQESSGWRYGWLLGNALISWQLDLHWPWSVFCLASL